MKKRAVQLLLPREEKQHLEDETVSCLRCAEDLTLEELLAELDAQPHLAQLRRALSPERKLYLLYGESEEMLKLALPISVPITSSRAGRRTRRMRKWSWM